MNEEYELVYEYTLPCGTKIKDVVDVETGEWDRYIQPIKPAEYITVSIDMNTILGKINE